MAIETSTKQPPKMQPRKSGELRIVVSDEDAEPQKETVAAGQ